MDKCKCFESYMESIKERLLSRLPENSADTRIDWKDRVFVLSGADYSPVNPQVEIEYRKPKKGGGHAKGKTRESISVMANYCVFCGRKLQKEGVE